MEPYKIIDVHSSFLCNDSFQQAGARDNESNGDEFLTGYVAAEKYLILDYDCPLNRLAVIPTRVNQMHPKKKRTVKKIIVMKCLRS